MKLEQRVEKLEQTANPEMGVAESIRRALNGTYVFPPHVYVPGRSRMEDAIYGPDTKKEGKQ